MSMTPPSLGGSFPLFVLEDYWEEKDSIFSGFISDGQTSKEFPGVESLFSSGRNPQEDYREPTGPAPFTTKGGPGSIWPPLRQKKAETHSSGLL